MPIPSNPHEQAVAPASASEGNESANAGGRRHYKVQNTLACSMFVLDEEVALLDRLLGAEISALFDQ